MLLILVWMLFLLLPSQAVCKEGEDTHKLVVRKINIVPVGAMESMPAKYVSPKYAPYFRLVKWCIPVTKKSFIYNYLGIKPGAFWYEKDLLDVRRRLALLPYFSTVSVDIHKEQLSAEQETVADIVIRTKDQFPIAFDLNLVEGPLFTLTHHNIKGYGHIINQQFFLKKRWGYGVSWELPACHGNYLLGLALYKQASSEKGKKDSYKFNYKDLWGGKFFNLPSITHQMPCYGVITFMGYDKEFKERPATVSATVGKPYHHHKLVLGKVSFVTDGYKKTAGVYTFRPLEELPNGGSIALYYGYQIGEFYNRPYWGIHLIKNVAGKTSFLYINVETGTFLHESKVEEAVVRFTLDGVAPPCQAGGKYLRPFIHVAYIQGYRMPPERRLAVLARDPEVLELPTADALGAIVQPIRTRLNVHIGSTLHKAIIGRLWRLPIHFVFIGFTNFIALYGLTHQLLNTTLVDNYGIGLRLAYAKALWPPVELRIAYSPLWAKVIPSIQFSICPFKLKHKPRLIVYS